MTLILDHAFITCAIQAPEAAALVKLGFIEGSCNSHPGQGTANRRFFFDNFMLELLWVENPTEASSAQTRRSRLWERWSGRESRFSRFGVFYRPADDGGSPAPFPTFSYHPSYLPSGMTIEIAQGTALEEPELFVLPFMRHDEPRPHEPVAHALPVRHIYGLSVGLPKVDQLTEASRLARDAKLLTYFESADPVLEIQFSSASREIIDLTPTLPLIFRGLPHPQRSPFPRRR